MSKEVKDNFVSKEVKSEEPLMDMEPKRESEEPLVDMEPKRESEEPLVGMELKNKTDEFFTKVASEIQLEALEMEDKIQKLTRLIETTDTTKGLTALNGRVKELFSGYHVEPKSKVTNEEAKKLSASQPETIKVSEEIVLSPIEIGVTIDNHLDHFLFEVLNEFQTKTFDRKNWANRIWKFTVILVISTFVLVILNYLSENLGWKKNIIDGKILFVFVGGMFVQVVTLMLIIMKYVFSPSKDVYSYLTELVKVRKLRDEHIGEGDAIEHKVSISKEE